MADRLKLRWTVDVDRDPSVVFDYLADFSRHHEWSPKTYRVEGLPPGALTVGNRFTSYGAIPGDKEHRNEVEITEVQRPTRLAFNAVEPNGEVFVNTFTVTANGDGSRVEREWDLPKPHGVMGAVFPVFLRAYIRPQVQKGLNNFKKSIEAP